MIGFSFLIGSAALELWSYAQGASCRAYDFLLNVSAVALLERAGAVGGRDKAELPASTFATLDLGDKDKFVYRVFTERGETLMGDPNLPWPDGRSLADLPFNFYKEMDGEPFRYVILRKRFVGSTGSQWIIAQVGQTIYGRTGMRNVLFFNGIRVLATAALLSIGFLLIGAHLAVRPLFRIQANLGARTARDFSPIALRSPREVGALVIAINDFMRRLEVSRDNAHNFIADVAHQMRTSLAMVVGQLSLACEPANSDIVTARVAKASSLASETIHLTNQLLAHAMVIHRADGQIVEVVDVVQLVTEVLESVVQTHKWVDAEFSFCVGNCASQYIVMGDNIALREAFVNLVDNALKYSGSQPKVGISFTLSSDRKMIAIGFEDNGPGIPIAERKNVLRRFYGVGNEKGSGLGLAIVDAVAKSHGGYVEFSDPCSGMFRVSIVLPVRAL